MRNCSSRRSFRANVEELVQAGWTSEDALVEAERVRLENTKGQRSLNSRQRRNSRKYGKFLPKKSDSPGQQD